LAKFIGGDFSVTVLIEFPHSFIQLGGIHGAVAIPIELPEKSRERAGGLRMSGRSVTIALGDGIGAVSAFAWRGADRPVWVGRLLSGERPGG
jgi:hypothetical protein